MSHLCAETRCPICGKYWDLASIETRVAREAVEAERARWPGLLKGWTADLGYIDKTLAQAAADPTDGHVPIWAREDRRTIVRMLAQFRNLLALFAPAKKAPDGR